MVMFMENVWPGVRLAVIPFTVGAVITGPGLACAVGMFTIIMFIDNIVRISINVMFLLVLISFPSLLK